ncbi:hypothetical protein N8987_00285 [Crocinitomix sp.]|nr:hypothetical protein [Crocinitomix sp.]
MALEKTVKTTLFQRVRKIILGNERPNLLTRVSVISGFIVWLYLFSWHLITLLSLLLLGNLKRSSMIRAAYNDVGEMYHYTDTINRLKLYSFIEVIVFLAILIGLILIWRRKKTGFLIYVISSVLTLLITYIVMGLKYFLAEIPVIDFILIGVSTAYFSIGILWFYRKKNTETTD